MPTIYLRKDLYDAIVQNREDVNAFVDKAVEKAIKDGQKDTKSEPSKATR
jgi:hypothetical protein